MLRKVILLKKTFWPLPNPVTVQLQRRKINQTHRVSCQACRPTLMTSTSQQTTMNHSKAILKSSELMKACNVGNNYHFSLQVLSQMDQWHFQWLIYPKQMQLVQMKMMITRRELLFKTIRRGRLMS